MPAVSAQTRRIAIIGNPNTGKTTLFNQLTGFTARVGNYPGVTVERRVGSLKSSGGTVEIIDLPGTYALAARSVDEIVAVDILLGRQAGEAAPDLIIVVLDASNLDRNLFLASQVLELGIPTILAANMMDVAERNGIRINTEELGKRLGVPIVPIVAARGDGLPELLSLIDMSKHLKAPVMPELFGAEFDKAARTLRDNLIEAGTNEESCPLFIVRRALLEVGGFAEKRLLKEAGSGAQKLINQARHDLREQGINLICLESQKRYEWIRGLLRGVVENRDIKKERRTEKIDSILVHRVWGSLIFIAIMLLVFQAIYSWSGPFMDLIDGGFAALGGVVSGALPEGPLSSFLADGVIAGVGGVLVFLPQIVILFLFLALLEDCGYMARAAVLMDRLLGWCGLSGRSFIPLITSFACGVPGIMATRVIEDRRERLTTILIAPLMSCSARLPVYTLMIGAFVPEKKLLPFIGLQAFVLFLMYLLGIAIAIPMALLLKRTLVRGGRSMFMMELPEYKRPSARIVFHRVREQAGEFVKRAGTMILAVSIIVWALAYYPHSDDVKTAVDSEFAVAIETHERGLETIGASPEEIESWRAAEPDTLTEDQARAVELADALDSVRTEHELALVSAWTRDSFLGRMGHIIEPVVEPIGWDWRIGMAVIASFPAREVVISTLAVIFGTQVEDDDVTNLETKLRTAAWPDGRPLFNVPVALSLMVFFALCAQCVATLAIIKRETNSWRWPVFTFAYLTAIAYIAAFAVYQVSSWLIG